MTEIFPIACYRPSVEQIAATVFETMIGIEIRPLNRELHGMITEFTAAVFYAGTWKGALLLECSAEQARTWTAHLMSLPSPITPEDARDGLGELANVIAGNLKPIPPIGVALSIPTVIQGSDYIMRICGDDLVERLDFEDAEGPFRITLVEVADKGVAKKD